MSDRSLMRRRPRVSLLPIAALLFACGDDGTPPDQVTLSLTPTTLSLFMGETGQLTATVSGASGATITFTSSPSGVVTVDGSGEVTAIGLGTSTVTATIQGEGVSATAQVTVNPSTISVTPSQAAIEVDETVQLTAQVNGGVGLTVTWTSGDEAVAVVDDSGLVTGVGGGTTDVTASVDGQPGVSAASEITVEAAPPEVVGATILDAQGGEADLADVGDLLTFVFDVEGEVGDGGRIDILVDGAVIHAEDFTIDPPAGIGRAMSDLRSTQQVHVEVSFAVASITGEGLQELTPPGQANIAAILNTFPGGVPTQSPIRIRGSTTLPVTFNQSPHLFITEVDAQGLVVEVDGRPVTFGDVGLGGQVLFDQGLVDRIEVVFDGASALYGSDAIAGAIDVTLKSSDFVGYEGPTTFAELRGFDGGGQPVPLLRGVRVVGGALPGIPDLDVAPPVYGRPFEIQSRFAISAAWRPEDDLALRAAYDPSAWSDYSGITVHRFDAGPTPGDWTVQDVGLGADLMGLDGLSISLSAYAEDPFGHFRREVLQDASVMGAAVLDVDLSNPIFTLPQGSGVIRDWQLGIGLGDVYRAMVVDPAGADGPFFSGLAPGSVAGRIERRWPDGSAFVFGDADEFAPAPGLVNGGVPLDFQALGIGEYFATFEAFDLAGNRGDLTLRAVYQPNDPVISDLAVVGSFFGGSDLEISATISDDLEILFAAAAVRYSGILSGSTDLYLIPFFQQPGVPFDDQYIREVDFSATLPRFAPYLETTAPSFPYAPTGSKFAAADALAGALNSGGRYGTSAFDLADVIPDAGPSFSVGGMDNFEHWEAFLELCNAIRSADCAGRPESGLFRARAFTTDQFSVESAQLFYQKRLPDGRMVGIPAGDPVTGTVQDFGSFKEKIWEFNLDATALDLGRDVVGSFWLGYGASGEALLSRGISLSIF